MYYKQLVSFGSKHSNRSLYSIWKNSVTRIQYALGVKHYNLPSVQCRDNFPFFDSQYMGLWYIQGRYDYDSTPEIADCMTSIYIKTSWGHANIIERSKILSTNT